MSRRCSASASRRRGTAASVPPEKDRARIATYFDPLPFWYPPFEEARIDRGRLPAARDHPAADADVPFLALAECLAAPDPRPEPAVHQPGDGARARPRRRRLGLCVEPFRPDRGADQADGRGQPGHGVDLERDRQAQRRLEPRSRLARIHARLFAQPPDLRPAARRGTARRRSRQCRPDHRPGRLVRSARPGREGARRRGRASARRVSRRCAARRRCRKRRRSCAMAAGSPVPRAAIRSRQGRSREGA